MSTSSPSGGNRPLSPFMIGPYYRPQLTSILSITHRITGVFLCLGALTLIYAWVALASGAEMFASFTECLASPIGMALVAGSVLAMWFHFFNGIRHLFWDAGHGLELATSYRSGYAVLALALVVGCGHLWLLYGRV